MRLASILVLGLALANQANAYPSGAPSCMANPPGGFHASRTDFHGTGYVLKVAPTVDGALITITGPADAKLEGLSLISSRGAVDATTPGFQQKCNGRQLTHQNPSVKALPWTFHWKNTEKTKDAVTFDYTLVEKKTSWAKMPKVSFTPVAVVANADGSVEPELIVDPTALPDEMSVDVTGCCYEVGYGAMMKAIYSQYQDVNSANDCPVSERMGGATRFEASDCAIVKAIHDREAMPEPVVDPTPAADPVPAEPVDPATLVDIAGGVGPVIVTDPTVAPATAAPAAPAPTTAAAAPVTEEETTKAATTKKPWTTKKAAGSTKKAGGSSTKKAGASGSTTKKPWKATTKKAAATTKPATTTTTTPAPVTEGAMSIQVVGCCYEVGYGAMMAPLYSAYADVSSPADCPAEERMGGATRFEPEDCATVQAKHAAEAAAPEETADEEATAPATDVDDIDTATEAPATEQATAAAVATEAAEEGVDVDAPEVTATEAEGENNDDEQDQSEEEATTPAPTTCTRRQRRRGECGNVQADAEKAPSVIETATDLAQRMREFRLGKEAGQN